MTVGGFVTLTHVLPHVGESSSIVPSVSNIVSPEGCCSTVVAMSSGSSSNCHAKCLVYAVGLVAGGAAIGYFIATKVAARRARINHKINLPCEKVVDSIDIEDIGEKKSFCRCWKSEKFPYCDGAHNKHNKETGDNVGPLTVKGKKPDQ